MQIDYLALVVLSVCAIFFYRAGRLERSWGVLWAALSIVVSLLALRLLPGSMIAVFVGQALLFAGITFWRMRAKD